MQSDLLPTLTQIDGYVHEISNEAALAISNQINPVDALNTIKYMAKTMLDILHQIPNIHGQSTSVGYADGYYSYPNKQRYYRY